MAQRKRGRPANPATEPRALTALQATLLAQAAKVGVSVDPAALEAAAGSLVPFSEQDLRVLEVVKDSPAVLNALARLAGENPDAFLRHVMNLLEFQKPKLARVEHTGNALGNVFIAVETRETGPPAKLVGKVVSEQ